MLRQKTAHGNVQLNKSGSTEDVLVTSATSHKTIINAWQSTADDCVCVLKVEKVHCK